MPSQADLKMEIGVANMLRVGVSVASVAVLTGWILYTVQTHGAAPSYKHFEPKPFGLIGAVHGVFSMQGRSLLELGVLLLVATPVLRVGICIVGFLQQKDKLYVAVSSIVLAVLLFSLFFRT